MANYASGNARVGIQAESANYADGNANVGIQCSSGEVIITGGITLSGDWFTDEDED